MGDRRPYYASLSIKQDERVREIREEVWRLMAPPETYERSEPHITVHPGFSCDNQTTAAIAGVLAYTIGETATVTGLSAWPDVYEPAVVKLDLDADLSMYRDSIESQVEDGDGTIDREPVPPHLTLFKCRDAGDEEVRNTLGADDVRQLLGHYSGLEVEVAGYRLERR